MRREFINKINLQFIAYLNILNECVTYLSVTIQAAVWEGTLSGCY